MMKNNCVNCITFSLGKMLQKAQIEGYAIGAFNCRYLLMIKPVLEAAQECRSPVIVQISQREIGWFNVDLQKFYEEAVRCACECGITVPFAVHLDHTRDMAVIRQAIQAGFTSVMIDASDYNLGENIQKTKEVVEYAHAKGVTVEAELGKIGSADKMETDNDQLLYTVPEEAFEFVEKTNVDALAVSIGTAHGVYPVKNPKIDFDRLRKIREMVKIPLVLHGGTGLSEDCIHNAVNIPNGGISKLNVATELELALLEAIGKKNRLTPDEIENLSDTEIQKSRDAVKKAVKEKMVAFLKSAGKA